MEASLATACRTEVVRSRVQSQLLAQSTAPAPPQRTVQDQQQMQEKWGHCEHERDFRPFAQSLSPAPAAQAAASSSWLPLTAKVPPVVPPWRQSSRLCSPPRHPKPGFKLPLPQVTSLPARPAPPPFPPPFPPPPPVLRPVPVVAAFPIPLMTNAQLDKAVEEQLRILRERQVDFEARHFHNMQELAADLDQRLQEQQQWKKARLGPRPPSAPPPSWMMVIGDDDIKDEKVKEEPGMKCKNEGWLWNEVTAEVSQVMSEELPLCTLPGEDMVPAEEHAEELDEESFFPDMVPSPCTLEPDTSEDQSPAQDDPYL